MVLGFSSLFVIVKIETFERICYHKCWEANFDNRFYLFGHWPKTDFNPWTLMFENDLFKGTIDNP